jgi:hypothetical protein
MKKIILLLSGIAALASGAYAQCSGTVVRTWNPASTAAADLLWSNPLSWTPNGVPDCDDDVIITTGRGRCNLNTSPTVRNISVIKTGSITPAELWFTGSYTLTCRKLTITDNTVRLPQPTTFNNTVIVDTLVMTKTCALHTRFLVVKGKASVGGGFIYMYPSGKADIKHLDINSNGTFQSPAGWSGNNNATTDIRGNFYIHETGKFIHNNGLLRLIDTGRNLINTAGSAGNVIREFFKVEINKKLDGAGDITQPGRLYTPWGSNERWVILSKLHLKEACLESWNTSEYLAIRDSLVIEASMSNNLVNYGLGFNGLPGAQGGMYLLFDGNKTARIISHGSTQGSYNIKVNMALSSNKVIVSGSRQEIGSNTHLVEITKGVLEFDGARNCRINANMVPSGLRVDNDGKLIAPDDDSLFFNGCWSFKKTENFNAQNGTVVLDGTGDKLGFGHYGDTVYFRNLLVRTAKRGVSNASKLNWSGTTDRLYVIGNLTVEDTSGAYFNNVQLFLEGNLTSNQTLGNTQNVFADRVWFVGSNNQYVSLTSASKAAFGKTVTLNKPSGSVTLNTEMEVREIEFVSGILNTTSSNKLTITRPDFIRGGTSTSYIDGPVRVLNGGSSSLWNSSPNTVGRVPVGNGGNYRPIAFSNAGNDAFEITFTAANAKSSDSKSSPIDEVSTTDLWRIDHISGTSNYKIKMYLTGKPASWNNTEVRIAAQADGSAPWYNQGGTYFSSDNMIWSTNVDITKGYMLFTHGRDVPAPMAIAREGISGMEVATVKAGAEAAMPEVKQTVHFNVYPNPVQGVLNLQVQNADKGVVTLSDMSGKMLGMFNAAEVKTLDMSNLSPGMYIVSFTDGLNNIRHRVIKH